MPDTRCTVQERTWKDELPELPDDVSALLAPPVVVRFDFVAAAMTGTMTATKAGDEANRTAGLHNPTAAAAVA